MLGHSAMCCTLVFSLFNQFPRKYAVIPSSNFRPTVLDVDPMLLRVYLSGGFLYLPPLSPGLFSFERWLS